MSATPPRPSLVERLRARRDRHLRHGIVYRGVFVLAGFTVLLAGLAMVVLPGPALIVIPIGLAMLALEFAWAENLLERALERAELAKQRASRATPRQRILSAIAITLAVAAAIALAVLYDVPLLPV
jgi:uncharacterized protein (TIGR02611 family)